MFFRPVLDESEVSLVVNRLSELILFDSQLIKMNIISLAHFVQALNFPIIFQFEYLFIINLAFFVQF